MPRMRRRKLRTAMLTWVLLLVCIVLFTRVIYRFPLLPKMVKYGIIGVIALLGLLLGWLSLRKSKSRKIGVSIVNTILSVALIFGLVWVPTVSEDVRNVIVNDTTQEQTTVNLYAVASEYKQAHSDIFSTMTTSENIMDYSNGYFLTQTSVDQENQSYVLQKLATMFSLDSVLQNESTTLWEALEKFFTAQGDVIILNSSYVTTVEEIYPNFEEDTVLLYSFTRTVEVEQEVVEEENDLMKPFAVLIAGSDSRDAALTTVTRTDVNIVAIVNPEKDEILLLSIPRDSYIPNPALNQGYDKLTHMGIYGVSNSCLALQQYLEIPLDKYVVVNFNTYTTIVNTLGGVDIMNPYEFSGGSYTFAQGNIHLSGDEALAYVRERYSLSDGDFGRNEHQIIILKAILKKMLSVDSLANFQNILSALSGTFLTNVAIDPIFEMISEELTSLPNWTITSRRIIGSTGPAETASMPGQSLSCVFPDETVTANIRLELQSLLEE